VFLTTKTPDVKKIPFYDHGFATKDVKNSPILTMHIVPCQSKLHQHVFHSLIFTTPDIKGAQV
jgi:hypothetical protein